MPPHPTIFVKKNVFSKVGYYSEKNKISSDYDWVIRVFKRRDIKIDYLSKTLSVMQAGGVSQTNIWKSFFEDWRITNKHKLFFAAILKRLIKIKQLW